jgi:acid phosphatase family membrane protein YuiD
MWGMILTVVGTTLLVQGIKTLIFSIYHHKFMWMMFFSTGGLPSSHAAFVVSTCAMLFILNDYLLSVPFIIALVLAGIVIHDAIGVRLEASKHAKILNQITQQLIYLDSQEATPKQLKELLGHRPIEVLVGSIIGILVPFLIWTLPQIF